jgi:hypothetical protein
MILPFFATNLASVSFLLGTGIVATSFLVVGFCGNKSFAGL